MADSLMLEAQARTQHGTRFARKLRKQGQVPAVLYGHKEATVSVALSAEALESAIRHGARVVDLKMEKGTEKALISDIQWDYLGKEVLHVDFTRVAADERITVPVAIELRGTAPGVSAGGLLDQPLHQLTVECLAIQVPDTIRVNIGELQIDGMIHVRDLHLPPDVKAMDDPDLVVVHVVAPITDAAPATEAGEQAEPEVIGRQKTAEEEAE
jgi:large subunit ribosomal protein L25